MSQELKIEKIYLKKMSYEVNNAPYVFFQNKVFNPNVGISLSTRKINEADDAYEVTIETNITINDNEDNSVLASCQIVQSGLFTVVGYEQAELNEILNVNCAHILFPYLRLEVENLVHYSGFPPFTLQPLSFHVLYQEKTQKESTQ